jgi:hypothetical protein
MARVAAMKRLVLSALIVVAFAAGCGDDDETTSPTAATTNGASGTTSPQGQDSGGETKREAPEPPPTRDRVTAESPGEDPETALEAYFISGDPDLVCGELATENLLRTAYGDEQGCRQAQVPAAVPKSIEIHSLDVSGAEAEATVTPTGGPNDGIDTTVTLVDHGGWRVDSLEADVPAGP